MASNDPRVTVPFQCPVSMKAALEKAAEKAGLPTGSFVRKTMADAIGYKLPAVNGAQRKYASAEEREAAQKARNKERRALVQELLAQHRQATTPTA